VHPFQESTLFHSLPVSLLTSLFRAAPNFQENSLKTQEYQYEKTNLIREIDLRVNLRHFQIRLPLG